MAVDQLIKVNANFIKANKKLTIHVIFDSSRLLPEYLRFDAQNNLELYFLKANEFLVLEF